MHWMGSDCLVIAHSRFSFKTVVAYSLSLHTIPNNQLTASRAIKMIGDYQVETVLYTDGSCKRGMEDGGSAVVVTTGKASNPVVQEIIERRVESILARMRRRKMHLLKR